MAYNNGVHLPAGGRPQVTPGVRPMRRSVMSSTLWAAVTALALVCGGCGAARAQCPGMEMPVPAGIADDFTYPVEPTVPSPAFLAYMMVVWPQPPTRQFDTQGSDEVLIHSFTGWQGPVCGARLEIRLAASWDPLSFNDSIRLSLVGGSDPDHSFRYWSTIANVIGDYPDDWQPGDVVTLTMDLANLPETTHGWPTNILDDVADGELELAVEDDTAVDYAVLHVCFCPVPTEAASWGRVKAVYGDRSNQGMQPTARKARRR